MSNVILYMDHVRKDYGNQHGIFDINLEVKEGETFGYVGTNGSGKTTTIRHFMGFIKQDRGSVQVKGMPAWDKASELKKYISYIPGEIEFPNFRTGSDFLKYQAKFYGLRDFHYMNELIELLELDPSANLARMSKGMKQKTAIVAALMADKEILMLDEPTTGLDPLMRDVFLELLHEEKKKGKTIFMSSHIFEEIEDICDRTAIIHEGKLLDVADIKGMRENGERRITVTLGDEAEAEKLSAEISGAASLKEMSDRERSEHERRAAAKDGMENAAFHKSAAVMPSIRTNELPDRIQLESIIGNKCIFKVPSFAINRLFHRLADYKVLDLREEHVTMEKLFREKMKEAGE